MTQVWILEPYGDGDSICLRSHLHKYLAVDQFGNVTCENEEKDESRLLAVGLSTEHYGPPAYIETIIGQGEHIECQTSVRTV